MLNSHEHEVGNPKNIKNINERGNSLVQNSRIKCHQMLEFKYDQDKYAHVSWSQCADPASFARGGRTLTVFFGEGRDDPNSTKQLKSGHHRPASEMPFKWRSLAGRRHARIQKVLSEGV